MHKHYVSQSAYGYDLEVTILLILFTRINKEAMDFLASFGITYKLGDQLWHKIGLFNVFDSCSVQTV